MIEDAGIGEDPGIGAAIAGSWGEAPAHCWAFAGPQTFASVKNASTTGATRPDKRFRRYGYGLVAEAIASPLKLRKKVEAKLYSPTTDELAMQPLIEKYLFESVCKMVTSQPRF